MVTQKINLNLIPGGVLPRINVSQYDKGSRTIELVLYNGETAFNVPAGANVQIAGTKRDNTGFEYSCTYADNVVSVDITDQMTVFGGEVVTELRILKDDDQLGTGNFIINVEPTALKDDVVISETDIPIIQQLPYLIAQAESSAELAHQWADYGDESDTPSATNNAKYWSIQAASAAAGCLRPLVVNSLPTQDISTVTLYFVPSSDPDTGNLYDEYINTDGTSAGWELIGSTGVDLSAYLQKTGDSKDNTVTYTSADDDTIFNSGNLGGQSAYAWTGAASLATGEKHSVLFNKISTMLKNIRTMAKLIGTVDISTIGTSPNTGTITGAIAKINSDLSELDDKIYTDDSTVTVRSESTNPGANLLGYSYHTSSHSETSLDFRTTDSSGNIADRIWLTQFNDANDKRIRIYGMNNGTTLTDDVLPTRKDVIPVRTEDYDSTLASSFQGDLLTVDLTHQDAVVNRPQFVNGAGTNGPAGFAGGWRYTLFLQSYYVLIVLVGFTSTNSVGMWLNAYNQNAGGWIGWKTVNMN